MSPGSLLLATRSPDKVREIRRILGPLAGLRLVDLDAAGVEVLREEDDVEVYDTFEENARAKALYFHRRTGFPTVADDSGLVVDALEGAPGVRSKRFAPDSDVLSGLERDRANNEHLLSLLGDLELSRRTARYVCVASLIDGGEESFFRGEAEGLILGLPRGRGGFGYDPLFYDRGLGLTFAEIEGEEKNRRSHRGKAFRKLRHHLLEEGE